MLLNHPKLYHIFGVLTGGTRSLFVILLCVANRINEVQGAGMNEIKKPIIKPAGDQALVVVFGNEIDLKLNRQVHALDRMLEADPFSGFIETVPTYTSLLVYYDTLRVDYAAVVNEVQERLARIGDDVQKEARVVEIPTRYGGEFGPDIDFVAEHNNLSVEEVIQIHCARDYPVYMMGFTPGFPYLGGMDARIAAPRLQSPRTHVPAGSVGIAGEQTGVYPLESPGGWQIIGRTTTQLFNPNVQQPFLLAPGDLVRFVQVKA